MKKFFKSSLFLLFIMFLFSINVEATENISLNDNSYTKSMADLQMAKRRLWIDHVAWTRSFIISDIASLEDKDYVLERLLRNQDDIGNSIKPYYGEEAGNKLSSLLMLLKKSAISSAFLYHDLLYFSKSDLEPLLAASTTLPAINMCSLNREDSLFPASSP